MIFHHKWDCFSLKVRWEMKTFKSCSRKLVGEVDDTILETWPDKVLSLEEIDQSRTAGRPLWSD